MIIEKPIEVDERGALLCPICDFEYMHRRTVYTAEDRIEIGYKGECGHEVELVLAHHKGEEFVGWVRNNE